MDPEVRQLRALLAVVDCGSFTAAADRLLLSQASVSRTVAALERTLGARVLQRSTREVALTPVGARVVGHARRVIEEIAAIGRRPRRPVPTCGSATPGRRSGGIPPRYSIGGPTAIRTRRCSSSSRAP